MWATPKPQGITPSDGGRGAHTNQPNEVPSKAMASDGNEQQSDGHVGSQLGLLVWGRSHCGAPAQWYAQSAYVMA